jgi:hypothetical protein
MHFHGSCLPPGEPDASPKIRNEICLADVVGANRGEVAQPKGLAEVLVKNSLPL